VERAFEATSEVLSECGGAESSEIPEVAARLFLKSLPVGGSAQDFAREQARMALDVFIGEMVGWSRGEDQYGRVGPKFRLKTNSAELILKTEMAESESAAVIGPTRLPASRVASPYRCNRCEPESLVEPSTTPSSSLSIPVSRLITTRPLHTPSPLCVQAQLDSAPSKAIS
jgi:hypothetical protein